MKITVSEGEVEYSAVRSAGAGGQNVNKVSSAVHLRFDIERSSLPGPVKARLLALNDQRITRGGIVVIKAQQHRSQDMNREAALARLQELVDRAAAAPKARRPTRPSRSARQKRLESKIRRGRIKQLRSRVGPEG